MKREKSILLKTFMEEEYVIYATYRAKQRIPRLDGLTETQRKIIFTVLENNITQKIKTFTLAAQCMVDTDYHHGDSSLVSSINSLCASFSNNIPLLSDDGSFGSRQNKKAGAPRYTYTRMTPYLKKIFHPDDTNILEYLSSEETLGKKIEPWTYLPVIPLALINGQEQVAVGFAVKILPRDPKVIINIIKESIKSKDLKIPTKYKYIDLTLPKFNGEIKRVGDKWVQRGKISSIKGKSLKISEIPVIYTAESYKAFLDDLEEKGVIDRYSEKITGNSFNIDITLSSDTAKKSAEELYKILGLEKTNTEIFGIQKKSTIQYLKSDIEYLQYFIDERIQGYIRRKEYLLSELNKELDILKNKLRFIKEVNSGKIKVKDVKEDKIVSDLSKSGYLKIDDSYSYLLNIRIQSLNLTRIPELENEINKVNLQIKTLQSKAPKDLWIEDLDNLERSI